MELTVSRMYCSWLHLATTKIGCTQRRENIFPPSLYIGADGDTRSDEKSWYLSALLAIVLKGRSFERQI